MRKVSGACYGSKPFAIMWLFMYVFIYVYTHIASILCWKDSTCSPLITDLSYDMYFYVVYQCLLTSRSQTILKKMVDLHQQAWIWVMDLHDVMR